MSWQDELRQLDEELAAGRIGAEQYRARRDQVIAAAANPTGAQPPSAAESTTMIPPVGGQPGNGPQADNPEATQVVPRAQGGAPAGSPADRTQAVTPTWQTGPRPGPQQGGYTGPASPAQGFPQQGQPNWGDQGADSAPPWAGQDFPPLAANNEAWVKQGPEVFGEGKSGKGRLFAIIGVVVVLLALGVGAFFLFAKGGGDKQTASPPAATTTAPHTTTTPPSPVRIGTIPGTDDGKKISNFSDVPNLDYLNPAELQAYQQAGAGQGNVAVHSLADGDSAVVLVLQADSTAAANTAVNTLTQIQVSNKATQAESPAAGVQVTELTANGTTQIRAHYVHDDVIVRVDVQGSNPTTALQDFNTVLNAQLAALSANG